MSELTQIGPDWPQNWTNWDLIRSILSARWLAYKFPDLFHLEPNLTSVTSLLDKEQLISRFWHVILFYDMHFMQIRHPLPNQIVVIFKNVSYFDQNSKNWHQMGLLRSYSHYFHILFILIYYIFWLVKNWKRASLLDRNMAVQLNVHTI